MKENRPKFLALFSGAGGFSIGFKEAGFECIGASDIDEDSEKTHHRNWSNVPFLRKNAATILKEDILDLIGDEIPDVIIGGPPCQGFSIMGDKHGSDPRNMLFSSYVNIVRELKPKCFVFENVKGLISMQKGTFLKQLSNDFANCGYDIYFKVLNAVDFGAPQSRERVIIFGTKLNSGFMFPEPSHASIGNIKSYKNVGEAINDLANNNSNNSNHIVLNHSERVIERYKLIPEGGRLPPPDDLPENIRRKNFGSTYIRLDRSKPSMTLVPGNNAFPIHPVLNRSLTPREAARIQTFPDGHIFEGNRRKQCILVGNAVPPILAANIALEVKNHLNNKKAVEKDRIFQSRTKAGDKVLRFENISPVQGSNEGHNFIDLFCGAGGISIGLSNAGFNPVIAADFNADVAKTHKVNFPNTDYVHGDLSSEETKSKILGKLKGKKITLLAGGPPCQGFSIFGKRRFINTKDYNPRTDPRNELVFTFWDYVKELQPEWVIMENVAGFKSLDDGFFVKELLKTVQNLGYNNFDCRILNSADYGVPQKRKRFILIANRTGHIIPWPKPKYFEKPESWQLPYRTVGEVITDLASESSQTVFKNHEPMAHSDMIKERYSYVLEGKKMDMALLPERLKYAKFTGQKIKNFSHVYRRLHREEPSLTLVPGHNAFPIHPWLNRLLTVREAARIQTFPDSIEFVGSSKEQCIQVGNAFPCMMAERIGSSILKAIANDWFEDNVSKLAHYSILDKWYFNQKEHNDEKTENFELKQVN